jgi:uncharacterized protein YheU (UPF0270 family)
MNPVEIPYQTLPESTLRQLVASCILREEIDDTSDLEALVDKAIGRLAKGQLSLIFESVSETLSLHEH